MSQNPVLAERDLPQFSQIKPEDIVPAMDKLLSDSKAKIQEILQGGKHDWEHLVAPLELVDEHLSKIWSPISHMNSVVNEDALREAYNACLPKLSDYSTEIGQNEKLFQAFETLFESDGFKQLNSAQQTIIKHAIRDFKLSGVALSADKKNRYKEIAQELSSLNSKFGENILDATNHWVKHITDKAELAGLPDSVIALAEQNAKHRELDGYVLTLEFPSYYPTMCYADSAALRQEMYTAYSTRASDQGPDAGKWDNTENMQSILRLRDEMARLLGFNNYAERSIATKMAESTEQVFSFLNELAEKSMPVAKQDLQDLKDYARDKHGVDQLNAWDVAYYSEKLREHKYAISQQELRPYFPVPKVLEGMFNIVNKLFGIRISEKQGVDSWHPDVKYFEIADENGEARGRFFFDLYARPHKRGGAWMDECLSRKNLLGEKQLPAAYLVCNFTPPVDGKPSQLTHDEVTTLFHEFGHGLHHMLTKIDYPSVAGISGVAWDAVELPSQFLENWCWHEESLNMISSHVDTGEALPQDLFEKLNRAKNFQSGMQMMRQLEFSLFDFSIHAHFEDRPDFVSETLEKIRDKVSVMRPPTFNRFAHSFSHIFAGGYAAGYYSYKWAEVLSADAFSKFEENGIFDHKTGLEFLQHILEKGGSQEAMDLFKAFRGREPSIEALLRHSGITQ